MTKKRAKGGTQKEPVAEQVAEQEEVDLKEVFGIEEPEPEEPEPVAEPEEPEPAPEPVAEEPVEEPEPAAEPEPAPEEIAAQEAEAHEKHEKGLLGEIQRLRNESQALKAQLQAPMPMQPAQQQPLPPTGMADLEGLEFEMGDDGKLRMDAASRQKLTAAAARAAVEATRPDPVQEAERTIENETQKWVAGDPQKFQESQKVRQAYEDMNVMIEHHTATNGRAPSGVTEWLQTLEFSGLGQTFQNAYPDIHDMFGFVETFFAPTTLEHRVEKVRRYMDVHMGGLSAQSEGAATEQAPAQSNVVKLQPDRPRPMSQKGSGIEGGTAAKEEFKNLEQELSADPMGMSPEYAENLKRMKAIARKLNIEVA